MVIRMFGTPIYVMGRKMGLKEKGKASTGTTKSEAKAASLAAEQLDIITNYIKEIGFDNPQDLWNTQLYNGLATDRKLLVDNDIHPGLNHIPFYGDNRAVVGACQGTQSDFGIASVAGQVAHLRESCELGDILPAWVSDMDNIADIGTKTLNGPAFHRHRQIISGHMENDFEDTLNKLEITHKQKTTRKPFKRKVKFEESQNQYVEIPSHLQFESQNTKQD